MPILNVNTDAVIRFTRNLEQLGKSDFPVAVRQSLNSAAFDLKQNTMPASAEKSFVERDKNFFKATSHVEPATGFDLRSMKAVVGFTGGEASQSVPDLEQQEEGGDIAGRSFIPLDTAREGNNPLKRVKDINRIKRITNIINANKVRFKESYRHKSQRFIRAVFMAIKLFGPGNAYVLGNTYRGRQTLSRIDLLASNVKTHHLVIERTPLYSYLQGYHVAVKSKGFMKRASYETGLKMESFYITAARARFEKALNK